MPNKKHIPRELLQWSYTGLVFISLAITTLNVAVASTPKGQHLQASTNEHSDTCLLPTEQSNASRRTGCTSDLRTDSTESFRTALESAFNLELGTPVQRHPASSGVQR